MLKDSKNFKFSSKSTLPNGTCQQESMELYRSRFRGKGKMIFDCLLSYRRLPYIKVKNSTIARKVGCDERTVQRWTSRFEKDGILSKLQANPYTPNEYSLNISNKQSFELWLSGLTEDEKEIFEFNGKVSRKKKNISFPPETVVQRYEFIYKLPIVTKPRLLSRARTREETQVLDGDGMGFLPKKELERRNRILKGMSMMKYEQKEWLLNNKRDPKIKQYLISPEAQALLFGVEAKEATELLGLNQREQFKMIAYPDTVLASVLEYTRPILKGFRAPKQPISDKKGWFFSALNRWCTKNQITPDWRWYYELCELLGIEALGKTDLNPQPLLTTATTRRPQSKHGGSPYDIHRMKEAEPVSVRVEKLRLEIVGFQNNIDLVEAMPKRGWQYEFMKDSVAGWQKGLLQCKEELEILERTQ